MSDNYRVNLIAALQAKIAAWVNAAAPRIRDEMCIAKIEILLSQPQSDDDGTLYLDYQVDETITSDSGGGRVEGYKHDL